MSDDLGIRFAREVHPVGDQLFAKLKVVFDDAVVHDRNVADGMGVGVGFVGAPVGRPSSVPEAELSHEWSLTQGFSKVAQFADRTHDFDRLAVVHGQPRRVIAAVFQPPKPVQQYRRRFTTAYVPDDSTHAVLASKSREGLRRSPISTYPDALSVARSHAL